jgi:hypothetical protein
MGHRELSSSSSMDYRKAGLIRSEILDQLEVFFHTWINTSSKTDDNLLDISLIMDVLNTAQNQPFKDPQNISMPSTNHFYLSAQ